MYNKALSNLTFQLGYSKLKVPVSKPLISKVILKHILKYWLMGGGAVSDFTLI